LTFLFSWRGPVFTEGRTEYQSLMFGSVRRRLELDKVWFFLGFFFLYSPFGLASGQGAAALTVVKLHVSLCLFFSSDPLLKAHFFPLTGETFLLSLSAHRAQRNLFRLLD